MSVAYGEQQRNSSALSASGAGGQRELERQYHVVLQDSLGHPALGFREGTWYRLTVSGPQPLQLRGAIRTCPHAAGSIVQIACWWMRENPMQPRSLDLATELALTVGELVRVCPADGLGTTSMDLLPMAMAAVAQSGPPASSAPALPSGSSGYAASGAGSSAFGSAPALGSSSSSAGSSDAFGSGSAFGAGANGSGASGAGSYGSGSYGSETYASGSSSGTYAPSNDGLSSTSAYGQTSGSGYGSSGAYSSTSGSASSSGYSSASAYGSSSTDAYSTSAASADAYGSSASGYGSSTSSASGYSTSGSAGGYSSSSSASGYEPNAYAGLADPLTDPLVQTTYSSSASAYTGTSDPLGQSAYSNGTYASSGSYDTAPTSYLPAATGAAVAGTGWFEPADGTGTGGFPAVPPAPVMGRQAPPVPPAPKKPYSGGVNPGVGRSGYQGAATQQAALPPASRPRESGADWEPRAAAPRRPAAGSTGSSHQPRPQQPQPAAPRQVPGANGQQPRPRPQQPRDGYGRPVEPQQDPGRSSDRNGAMPPRRPAPAATPPQRGTMGQRPASRPRRPSER